MRKIILLILIVLPFKVFAIDPAIVDANNQYFNILKNIEIIKDTDRPQLERQRAFSHFANEFGEPGAHWQTLKVAVLDIIIADAEFWASEITQFPAIQEKLMHDFNMDWYNEGTSNYSEKLNLAKIQIIKLLEKQKIQKKMLEELHHKLSNTKPTTLD